MTIIYHFGVYNYRETIGGIYATDHYAAWQIAKRDFGIDAFDDLHIEKLACW